MPTLDLHFVFTWIGVHSPQLPEGD